MEIDLNHACVSTKISFITARNSSCGKVMCTPLDRSPQAVTPRQTHPPRADTPLGRHASHGRQTHPPWEEVLRTDTSLGRHPPWADNLPPGQTPPDGYCSGRYVSYWNAFFLSIDL